MAGVTEQILKFHCQYREIQEHIVMLPMMAHGHLIPFLALARKIQERTSYRITIASTRLNIHYLTSAIAKDSVEQTSNGCQIHLVELPFKPEDRGLPPNVENTEAVSLPDVIKLFYSSTSLEPHVHDLVYKITTIEGKPPLCIISDIFFGWANKVAKSLGTVNVSFITGGAYGYAAYLSMWIDLPHQSTKRGSEFTIPCFPETCIFDISQIHSAIRAANGTDPWSSFFRPQISLSLGSFGWLCNTSEGIEALGSNALRKFSRLPVWCIGPLLPQTLLVKKPSSTSSIIGRDLGKQHGISPEECIEWLDKHSQGSVLYVSFGSQNSISPSQMMALALGLEESEKPFIWVIRPPVGFANEFTSIQWLPKGYQERIEKGNRGLLVHTWAPQLEILCHSSVGAFLSHCGWNSTMESLSQGVPIIAWPLAAEQAFNSKMLMEEMGACIELTRGSQSVISKEEVKSVINLVMNKEGKGREMREKAVEIGRIIREASIEDERRMGSSAQAMDDFVSTLLSLRNAPK